MTYICFSLYICLTWHFLMDLPYSIDPSVVNLPWAESFNVATIFFFSFFFFKWMMGNRVPFEFHSYLVGDWAVWSSPDLTLTGVSFCLWKNALQRAPSPVLPPVELITNAEESCNPVETLPLNSFILFSWPLPHLPIFILYESILSKSITTQSRWHF